MRQRASRPPVVVRADADLIASGRQCDLKPGEHRAIHAFARLRHEVQVELLTVAALHSGALVGRDDRHFHRFDEPPSFST